MHAGYYHILGYVTEYMQVVNTIIIGTCIYSITHACTLVHMYKDNLRNVVSIWSTLAFYLVRLQYFGGVVKNEKRKIHNIHTRVRQDWAVTENMQVPIIETQHSIN